MVLNPNQTYLGRAVALLKRPCGDLAEITDEEMLDFLALVRRAETVYRSTLGATMFNWSCLMNNAYQETPPRPHVHWHLVPRYAALVNFAGRDFSDPNFGHRSLADETKLSPTDEGALVQALRAAFDS